MKTYFFIALAMLCHTARAQNDALPTIYFNNGKTITAEKIRLRTGAFKDLYLLADGKQIKPEGVKFFQNNRGFFANTRLLNPVRISGFAERTDQGRINLFREMPRHYDLEFHEGDRWYGETGYPISLYYNKGLGNLKKITYSNLIIDLQDNQQSMDFLAAYRKKRKTANIFLGVAGASLLAGMVSFVSSGNQSSSYTMSSNKMLPNFSYVLMGVGAGFGIVGALNYASSRDELVNAIDSYNR